MSRIDKVFKRLRSEKRKALVIFLTAGDPGIGATVRLVNAACDAGADIIELGVPFSDPLADGPVIQASYTRAIKKGMNLKKTFETVKKIRATGCETPIVLMVSCTLVINHGVEKFMKDGARAGVDGLILPDVPVEEGDEFLPFARKADLDTIFLAAPTSTSKRLRKIASLTRGFLYYISLTGITGKKKAVPADVGKNLKKLRKITKKPVCVGFGVTSPGQARAIARYADGIVIGSEAIRVINKAGSQAKAEFVLKKFVRSIRRGLDS